MAPFEGFVGSVLLAGNEMITNRPAEGRLRSDVGTVLAAGRTCPLIPGDVVLLDHSHGKRIEGGQYGQYVPSNEVRFYGAAIESGAKLLRVDWRDSLLATIETNDIPLPFVQQGQTVLPTRWLSDDRYECYFRVANNANTIAVYGIGEDGTDNTLLTVPVRWRRAYRLTVYKNGDTTLHEIGDDFMQSWRELGAVETLRPLGRMVMIRRGDLVEKESIVHRTDRSTYRSPIAEVVAVGPEVGVRNATRDFKLKAGDRVIYMSNAPRPLRWFGAQTRDLALIHEDGILCILEESADVESDAGTAGDAA